jgi:K+-transporting ATPase KdpF subunit
MFDKSEYALIRNWKGPNEFNDLAGLTVFARARDICRAVCLHQGLRGGLKGTMEILTWTTAIVTALLLVYLFAALIRPEWF